jgi:hypothetical protein
MLSCGKVNLAPHTKVEVELRDEGVQVWPPAGSKLCVRAHALPPGLPRKQPSPASSWPQTTYGAITEQIRDFQCRFATLQYSQDRNGRQDGGRYRDQRRKARKI